MKNWISKRKWIATVLCVILVAGITVFMAACNDEQVTGDITVSLSASSIQLDIYETLELKAQVQGSDETLVWTTEDSTVATVENGIVTAVGEGTTNVIATVGEVSCACQVSVVNSYTAPVIVVNTPNIGLGLNEQYDLSVRLLWKGAEVTDHAGFEWSLADGGVADVVSVEQTANGATIKALSYGKTSYTVSTTYREQLVAQKVNIKVTNLDITFEIDNMEKSAWAYSTKLGLFATDTDITSIVPNVTVYNKGVKVDNAAITWESENPEIATVDANGKITAVSTGTVRIVGWYENAEIPVDVEVYRTKILLQNAHVERANNYMLSVSLPSGSGEIIDVLYDGQSVLKETKGGQPILDSQMLPENGKEVGLFILTEKAEYTTEGMMATLVINSNYELSQFPKYQAAYPDGYFALGADIRFEGEYSNSNTTAFTGTFDGCGYVIYNMATKTAYDDWDGGFFGKEFHGTLKNIAFQNAIVRGQGAFLAFRANAGTMENVYIYAAFDGLVSGMGWINDTSVLFNDGNSNYLYATNVIVEYDEPLTENAGYAFYQNVSVSKFNGLYVVGAKKISAGTMPGSSTAYGCYANRASFRADVSEWDGNGFWTVVKGFPIPNRLLNYKLPPKPETVTLDGGVYLEKNSDQSTFVVDLSSVSDKLSGREMTNVTVNGVEFATKSYDAESGLLTLDRATLNDLLGETTVAVNFGKLFQVKVKVVLCTQVIDTAEELRNFPAAAKENPSGYYALGADIYFTGTYSNTNTAAFTGTFDGCGHVIFNMATKTAYDDWDGGFFGKEFHGTLKNIAFQNAIVRGQGAFLAFRSNAATMKDVYIHATFDGLVSGLGWINDTSVLFNDGNSNYLYATNVIVEYDEPLTTSTGYPFYQNISVTFFNGLYVIGADKISVGTMPGSSTAYACFADRASFNADVSAWDGNGFWTVVDGFPIPNSLVNYVPPKEPETVTLDDGVYLEKNSVQSTFMVDLRSVSDKLSGLELTNATVDGVEFATKSYDAESGMLTLDRATLNDKLGETTVAVNFGELFQVKVKVVLCTQVINTVAELKNFPTAAKANPSGYFALGADIWFEGEYSNPNTTPFTGTFDGCGHVIYNMATKTAYDDWDGGFFGKEFHGTLKNIAFQNAIVRGQGAFLAFRSNAATMKDVYVHATFDGLVSGLGWINDTSVLFNDGNSNYLYATNVIVEYAEPLTTSTGYPFYQNISVTFFNGLYVIGADKISVGTMPGSSTAYACFADRASFNADVSAWDGNSFWTVVDGFPIPNGLVDYDPSNPPEPSEPEETEPAQTIKLQLTDKVLVDKSRAGSIFTVNFGDQQSAVAGTTLSSASVAGKAFRTYTYADGILTLDKATFGTGLGEETVQVTFMGEGKTVEVEIPVVVCTKVFLTADELRSFPAAAKATPSGYFALGADIWFEGDYSNTNTAAFTGTFDGCGHVIYNMATKTAYDDWDGGFFGKEFHGTLKNIAFQNAIVRGQGAFLAFRNFAGTMENVYIHVAFDGLVSGLGWINDTSVLFNDGNGNYLYATNVIVEYAEPLTASVGYPFYHNLSVSKFNGLYVIGADKISAGTMPGSSTAYACFADRASFNADVSAWDGNGFWTVVDGFPIPNGLVDYDPSNPPEPSEPEGTEPPSEPTQNVKLQLTDKVLVDKSRAGSIFTVNFGDQQSVVADTELSSASVAGKAFRTYTYADGILTLDKTTFGTGLGEKTVQVTFTGAGKTVEVEIPVVVCTKVFLTADELRSFPAAAKATPGGYFALGADIHFEGNYSNTNTTPFTGTFDGCGHVIYDMATKITYDDWDGGFFGKEFHGTLKNIAFQNAIVRGQGAFLAFRSNAGTMENVYVHATFDGLVSGLGWINDTSVLFNDGNQNYLYATNVIVEYAEPLTASTGYPFYHNLSVSKFNGLYVIGADKISAGTMPGSSTAYACYADRASFDADVSAWDGNGFWTVVDGFPIPNGLVDYEASTN